MEDALVPGEARYDTKVECARIEEVQVDNRFFLVISFVAGRIFFL